jgi:hypothetical protein
MTFVNMARYQFKPSTFSMLAFTIPSVITDIPSSTQVGSFTVYSHQHTSSIGRVGAIHSPRYSIARRDIVTCLPTLRTQSHFLTVY